MWLQAGNETTRRRLPVYQHHQRPDCQSKITWNQVCVLARHKFWRFIFGKTLATTEIAPACCYERFTIFPRNLSCQSSYFWWKLVGLFFSAASGVETKNLQIRAGSLSRLAASPLDFALAATLRTFVLFRARGYAARLCANVSLLTGYVIKGVTSKITLNHLTFRLYTPRAANSYDEQICEPPRKREI